MTKELLGGAVAAFLLLTAEHVHGAIAWVAIAPLLIVLERPTKLASAMAMTIAFCLITGGVGQLPWLAQIGRLYFDLGSPAAWVASTTVVLILGIGYGSCLGLGVWSARQFGSSPAAILLPFVWAAWEELHLQVVPYYPWLSLAATQIDFPAISPLVAVLGQRGLSFLISFTGANLAVAVRFRRTDRRRAAGHLLLAIAAPLATSSLTLANRHDEHGEPTSCTVVLGDAAIESGGVPADEMMRRYDSLLGDARPWGPSVVVLPESALPFDPTREAAMKRSLDELVGRVGSPLIAGGRRVAFSAGWTPEVFNSAFFVGSDGSLEVYDKSKLVPAAEYWPAIGFDRPSWLAIEETNAGAEARVFHAGPCALGPLICFEAEFPWLSQQRIEAGATSLLVLSNDAELPDEAVASEVTQARLRALETGLPVLRSANHGLSLLIDPRGKILMSGRGGLLTVRLPRTVAAPARYWAKWIVLTVSVVAGVVVVLAVSTRRRYLC